MEELHRIFGNAEQQVWHDMEMLGKADPSYRTLNYLGLLFSYLFKATICDNKIESDNSYTTPHKEFFNFIYYRLKNVHNENPDLDYMRSLRERIDDLFK